MKAGGRMREADRLEIEGLRWRADKLAGDVAVVLSRPMVRAVLPAEVQGLIRELAEVVRGLAGLVDDRGRP